MSISVSPRSSGGPANPTRQQLDELDALLQRMLNLPVNKMDNLEANRAEPPPLSYAATDAEGAPAEGQAAVVDDQIEQSQSERQASGSDESATTEAPSPGPASLENKAEGEAWVPLSSTWQPSALTWKPLARSWKRPNAGKVSTEQEAANSPAAASSPNEQQAPPVPADIVPPIQASNPGGGQKRDSSLSANQAAVEEPIARWATLLVWCNNGFDLCLTPLGALGRFCQTRPGRLGLAILGLGCIVAAAVVSLIDWIGWTC
jgi:hypothetical protein